MYEIREAKIHGEKVSNKQLLREHMWAKYEGISLSKPKSQTNNFTVIQCNENL